MIHNIKLIFSRNSSLRCQSKNCSRFWQLSTWLYHGAGRPIARKVHGSRFNLQLWANRALFPRFHRQSTNQFFISSKRSCSILTDSSIKKTSSQKYSVSIESLCSTTVSAVFETGSIRPACRDFLFT